MSRLDGPDPGAQRTVAELLAQYGGQHGPVPRRRRRRDEPDLDPPQTTAEQPSATAVEQLPRTTAQHPPGRVAEHPPGRVAEPTPLLTRPARSPGALFDDRPTERFPALTDGLTTDDDPEPALEEPASRSPAREWLVVAGQLALGALAGAALWVVFQWLWRSAPPVALVVAVLVTIGLVFGVRTLRRTDDLQTTALAVVVGLVVTVSPAALVLTAR